jgi:hypothetical protein
MSIPTKKGIRKITLDDIQYYYTINKKGLEDFLIVKIGIVDTPNQRFLFCVAHKDFWLYFPKPVENKVKAVTSTIIRKAIAFANRNSLWTRNSTCIYEYKDNIFQ